MSILGAAGSYFAHGHNSSRFFLPMPDWEDGLFLGTLFRQELHIQDSSAIGSAYLYEHLCRNRSPHLTWAAEAFRKHVLVIRKRDESSLTEIARRLSDGSYADVHRNAEELAKTVENLRPKENVWPNIRTYNSSRRYFELVKKRFDAVVPLGIPSLDNEDTEDVLHFWTDVKAWRTEWIAKAHSRLSKSDNQENGLRLSDIVAIAAEDLGVRRDSSLPLSMISVLNAIKQPHLHKNLSRLFRAICELYNQNLAATFRCHPASANLDLCTASVAFDNNGVRHSNILQRLQAKVKLPSVDEFRRCEGSVLTALRESDEGRDYFKQLAEWGSHRCSDEHFVQSIQGYAKRICREVAQLGERKELRLAGAQTLAALLAGVGTVVKMCIQRTCGPDDLYVLAVVAGGGAVVKGMATQVAKYPLVKRLRLRKEARHVSAIRAQSAFEAPSDYRDAATTEQETGARPLRP